MEKFLTTKEVAALLRIKERKVYELVADNAIPVSRATGKLLFPRDLVETWVRRHTDYSGGLETLADRPVVMAGSHDPLLDWALRESGSEIATFFDGSLSGLDRLKDGKAIGAGMHVAEPENNDWNKRHVADALPGQPVVMLQWAWRVQGLLVPKGNPLNLQTVADLKGRVVIPRQGSAGSRVLLDHLMKEAGLTAEDVHLLDPPARSETDVAMAVAEGKADVGLAIETVAKPYQLDFVALAPERYDLVLWRREIFQPPLQKLLAFCRTPAFSERAAELGGYDVAGSGTVQLNGA